MTDTSQRIAGISNERTFPNCVEVSLAAGAPPGTPIANNAGVPVPGRANSASTSNLAGLLIGAAAEGEPGFARYAGPVTLTEDEWDTIAGTDGGLVGGDYYYLSAATAGKLTATPPSAGGQFVAPAGLALSSTTLLVLLSPPVAAGG